MVKLLISKGANPNLLDDSGRTTLCVLVLFVCVSCACVVCLCVSKYADVICCVRPLRAHRHWAALHGTVGVADAIKACAEFPCDVNAKTKVGATALHMAAEGGKVEFMQWLLANKADVLAKDGSTPEGGKTAWELAKEKQMEPVMALLKAAGGASVEAAGGCCIVS